MQAATICMQRCGPRCGLIKPCCALYSASQTCNDCAQEARKLRPHLPGASTRGLTCERDWQGWVCESYTHTLISCVHSAEMGHAEPRYAHAVQEARKLRPTFLERGHRRRQKVNYKDGATPSMDKSKVCTHSF